MNASRTSTIAFLSLLAVAVALGAYLLFRPAPTIKNYPPKDGTIVAFGDSLIAGTGSTPGNDLVSDLSQLVGEPIDNLGTPGDTARQGLDRINDVLSRSPRIAIVLFGGNDFLQLINKNDTFDNLRQIIEKIQESGAIVLLLGIRGGVLVDAYASRFQSLAAETGSAFVPDVLDGIDTDVTLMSDSVHPNDAGYKRIADKIYPVLRKLLR